MQINYQQKKKNWIIKKLEEDNLKQNIKKRNFSDGEIIFKFGKKKILSYKKSSLNEIIETKNIIRVYCPAEKEIKGRLEYWYKETLNCYIKKNQKC